MTYRALILMACAEMKLSLTETKAVLAYAPPARSPRGIAAIICYRAIVGPRV